MLKEQSGETIITNAGGCKERKTFSKYFLCKSICVPQMPAPAQAYSVPHLCFTLLSFLRRKAASSCPFAEREGFEVHFPFGIF